MYQEPRKEPRKEPSFLSGFGIIGAKRKSHNEILNGALSVFDEAQSKLDNAFGELSKQIADDEIEIARMQREVVEASDSLDRLQRVRERFASLLS